MQATDKSAAVLVLYCYNNLAIICFQNCSSAATNRSTEQRKKKEQELFVKIVDKCQEVMTESFRSSFFYKHHYTPLPGA